MSERPAALFASSTHQARELRADEVPRLQALFDANPDYFVAVSGRPANADEAQAEFDELPPPHLSYRRRWLAGLYANDDTLVGVCIVVADLATEGAWHIALFLVETRLHGRGVASALYDALEAWARDSGAAWLRLGVVQGNARAERFWARKGYVEIRQRPGTDTGGRLNTIRVLLKPLAGLGIDHYLARVPRDRPGSTLP